MRKLFANPHLLLTLTVLLLVGQHGHRTRHPWRHPAADAGLLALGDRLPARPAARPAPPQDAMAAAEKGWKPLLVLGLLGVGGYNTFAYLAPAAHLGDERHAAQPSSRSPPSPFPGPSSARLATPRGHRRPSSRCAGALTIVSRGDLGVLANFNLNLGDIWMLIAVLDWAIYTVALAGGQPACIRC